MVMIDMTKRFTDIEHDYENAWIKCKDNGLFMIYPIYEDETEMPTLGDLLNGLVEENEQLKNEIFDWKASAKDYLKLGQLLKKENEQLKQRIKVLEDTIDALAGTIAHFDLDEVMWND